LNGALQGQEIDQEDSLVESRRVFAMATKKAKSSDKAKSSVRRRSRLVTGSEVPTRGVPGSEQDPRRRMGNFEGVGEHARVGGRTSGIVGQTTKQFTTDKAKKPRKKTSR
jgi:hypothetical protein